jgi:hypothetical protein
LSSQRPQQGAGQQAIINDPDVTHTSRQASCCARSAVSGGMLRPLIYSNAPTSTLTQTCCFAC